MIAAISQLVKHIFLPFPSIVVIFAWQEAENSTMVIYVAKSCGPISALGEISKLKITKRQQKTVWSQKRHQST